MLFENSRLQQIQGINIVPMGREINQVCAFEPGYPSNIIVQRSYASVEFAKVYSQSEASSLFCFIEPLHLA